MAMFLVQALVIRSFRIAFILLLPISFLMRLGDDRPDSPKRGGGPTCSPGPSQETDRGFRVELPVRGVIDSRVNDGIGGIHGDRCEGFVRRLARS